MRPSLPDQRHAQLRADFLRLTSERLDMIAGSRDYAAKTTEIDQVLASVWRLGTIYSQSPCIYDTPVVT